MTDTLLETPGGGDPTPTSSSTEPGVKPLFDTDADWESIIDSIDWHVEPEFEGPTWDRNPAWEGPRDPDGYILPEFTLGWEVVKWIEDNLLADETDENDQPLPFQLTAEQLRFILHFYAIDEDGRFLYREFVLQRLKGWG